MNKETKEYWKPIIRYVIYLILVLGLTLLAYILTIGNKSSSILQILRNADVLFIFIILLIVIACILFRSLAIFFLTRIYAKKYPFYRAIAIDQIGTLYRMITPAGVGGHVSELIFYRKQNISISNALSVLVMYSIVYQVVLIIFNIITLIVKGPLIGEIGAISITFSISGPLNIPLWLLVSIGFVINLSVIGFIFLLSYWNGFYNFIHGPIAKLLNKIHIVKNLESFQIRLDASRDNFRNNLKALFKHVPTLIMTALCFVIYIMLSYSVPYFCGLALNSQSSNANFIDSIFLSNFHQMITCIIPLPGNALTSELFFLKLFYPTNGPKFYQSEEIARTALLLWRSLMFIIPLFISCLYALIYRPRKRVSYEQNKEY